MVGRVILNAPHMRGHNGGLRIVRPTINIQTGLRNTPSMLEVNGVD